MLRKMWFVLGYLRAGIKGIVFMFFDPIDPNGHDVREENWGLDNPKLRKEWLRLGNGEPWSHTLTNIVVEYAEVSKHGVRTFVKLSAAWTILGTTMGTICGFILGALVF